MVELFEQNERQNDRQSSKGNQLKWKNDGIWYKADYTGYEGLAEYMISHLLQRSSLRPNEFVLYEPEQIKREEIRLDELLLDARELVLRAHPDFHVELVFEQEAEDDKVLTVIGNSYLLTTAFVNLIENNCKYSRNQTSFIQISFWEEWSIIRLSDDGVGMSDKDKEHLFQLFYRGENKDVASGYGIGMTLAQKIQSLHKGEISVFSHPGEGTTYVVKLPHI